MRSCHGAKDMECLAHTITHMGEHLSIALLLKFKQDICALIKDSYHSSSHWFDTIGHHFLHPGNTRWWAVYDLYVDLLKFFELVVVFVTTAVTHGNVGEDGARIQRLTDIISCPSSRIWLKLELSVVVITMKPVVDATYLLEGSGPTALIAYDLLENIRIGYNVHITDLTFPGMEYAVDECVEGLADGDAVRSRAWVISKVRGIITPSFDYFTSRIYGMLSEDIGIYKTLRYTNPVAVRHILPDFSVASFKVAVQSLRHFDEEEIERMLGEIPEYLTIIDNISTTAVSRMEEMKYAWSFWVNNKYNLPILSRLAQYAFTITTSSASAERSFSVLKRCFGNDQRLALEDYSMLSCMMQTNKR